MLHFLSCSKVVSKISSESSKGSWLVALLTVAKATRLNRCITNLYFPIPFPYRVILHLQWFIITWSLCNNSFHTPTTSNRQSEEHHTQLVQFICTVPNITLSQIELEHFGIVWLENACENVGERRKGDCKASKTDPVYKFWDPEMQVSEHDWW